MVGVSDMSSKEKAVRTRRACGLYTMESTSRERYLVAGVYY